VTWVLVPLAFSVFGSLLAAVVMYTALS